MRTLERKDTSEWQFDPSQKMDIRDLCIALNDDAKVFEFLMERLVDMDIDTPLDEITPTRCDSFEELNEIFKRNLSFWPQKNTDALAVAIACVISIRLKGPLLWMYLVGPSGCGKSTICNALGADRVHTMSYGKITSLHSGWKMPTDEKGKSEDVSLISKLRNKTLIVKDFTALLNQPPQQQEKLYGELRDAYDGETKVIYGNGIDREYRDINFTLVAGVTHKIHSVRKSALGERFFKVNMDADDWFGLLTACVANVSDAVSASAADPSLMEENSDQSLHGPILKAATLGFLQHLFQKLSMGVIANNPPDIRRRLVAMGALIAAGRGDVEYDKDDPMYRPVPEVGSHIAGQLSKLMIAVAIVLDRTPDEEVFRIVKNVAWHTAGGYKFDVIQALAKAPFGLGLTKAQIAGKADVSYSVVDRELRDLMELKIVYKQKQDNASGVGGRDADAFFLSDRLQKAWEEIEGKPQKLPAVNAAEILPKIPTNKPRRSLARKV